MTWLLTSAGILRVGPNLAENICDPGSVDGWKETLISRNPNSMFLSAVEEREIIDIVNTCKSKTTTDCDDIDMTIAKSLLRQLFNH